MRPSRLGLLLVALAGLALVSREGWAGARPTTATPAEPRPKSLQDWFGILDDPGRPDDLRAQARTLIVGALTRDATSAQSTGAMLLDHANQAASDSVRMQYAIILSYTRADKTVIPAAHMDAAIGLLTQWLDATDADPALSYWAAKALASTQNPKVLPTLKDKALAPGRDAVIRAAAARALATWRREDFLDQVIPVLRDDLLADKNLEIRIAACDTLRLSGLNERPVIDLLLKTAQEDPEERVWRAANSALRVLGKGDTKVPPGATPEVRKEELQKWYKWWQAKKRSEEKTAPKKEGEGE
jgi:hypothetical protein